MLAGMTMVCSFNGEHCEQWNEILVNDGKVVVGGSEGRNGGLISPAAT